MSSTIKTKRTDTFVPIASTAAATVANAIMTAAAIATGAIVGAAGCLALGSTGAADSILRLTKTTFNTVEAMQILGLSKNTILKKLKTGELHYEGNGGKGGYRISQKDIENYARLHKIKPNWDNFKRTELTAEEFEKQVKAVEAVESNPVLLESMIKILEAEKRRLELGLELKKLDLEEGNVMSLRDFRKKFIVAEQLINEYDKMINSYKLRLHSLDKD